MSRPDAFQVVTPHYLDPVLARHKRAEHVRLLDRWLTLEARARVLKTDLFDEAMGEEGFLGELAVPGQLTVGIDFSDRVVAASRANLPAHVAIVIADVGKLPFRSGSLSSVVSNSTLDHFVTKGELDGALSELARVVRPGGIVIVTLDNPQNVFFPLLRAAAALGLTPFPLGRTYNVHQLRAAMTRAGLEVTDCTAIIHNPRLVPTGLLLLARWLRSPAIVRAAHRLQRWFVRFEGSRWQYRTGCFVAVRAEKPVRLW